MKTSIRYVIALSGLLLLYQNCGNDASFTQLKPDNIQVAEGDDLPGDPPEPDPTPGPNPDELCKPENIVGTQILIERIKVQSDKGYSAIVAENQVVDLLDPESGFRIRIPDDYNPSEHGQLLHFKAEAREDGSVVVGANNALTPVKMPSGEEDGLKIFRADFPDENIGAGERFIIYVNPLSPQQFSKWKGQCKMHPHVLNAKAVKYDFSL